MEIFISNRTSFRKFGNVANISNVPVDLFHQVKLVGYERYKTSFTIRKLLITFSMRFSSDRINKAEAFSGNLIKADK